MDVRRITLIAGLAVVSYIMILQWSNDYSNTSVLDTSTASSVVTSGENSTSNIPTGNTTTTSSDIPNSNVTVADTETVTIVTDTLNVTIDLNGGDVVHASLPKYPYSLDTPDVPFDILDNKSRTYTAQSGLVGNDGIDSGGSRAIYTTEHAEYKMQDDSDTLEVVLTHTEDNGLIVNKVFSFKRNTYVIGIRFDLNNTGTQTLETNLFSQLRRDNSGDPSNSGGIGMRSFLGTTFSTTDSSYEKISFKDLDDESYKINSVGGWAAIIQHYFLSAVIPASNDNNSFYGQKGKNGDYYAGYQSPSITVSAGEQATIGTQLYVGPKDQDTLREIASNLEKTVDYGWLWWLAEPIFWILTHIHSLFGNWGWSIVALTLLLKTILYPLTASSYRSMAKMKKFAPKIQELKEQFGDDRQRMSQEMMKLYQKEKLNPLGGCLPMLIQMPVFIALYWTLMESVELRQSPFMFWIVDLSLKDPYFVLPLLMGVSMFFQMQMQQQPSMDPMQAKVMKFMPVMFTFMFLWFPAGLTLYWLVNNLTTITQQYIVNRSVARADAKPS